MLYDDPFVQKHKNKYRLLRKIHYDERLKLKNLVKLLPFIKNDYNDWRGDFIRWYNKWVTEGYSPYQKHLFLYGEQGISFVNQIMGNYLCLFNSMYNKILSFKNRFVFRTSVQGDTKIQILNKRMA